MYPLFLILGLVESQKDAPDVEENKTVFCSSVISRQIVFMRSYVSVCVFFWLSVDL